MNLPRHFGRYSLLRRLAVGGMAEIYVAKTRGLGGFEKLVAIKLVHPHLSADPHFIRMLIDEANILVLLTHTNIAQVFDLGCIEGTYYIAMEFVEGFDVHGLQTATAKVGRQLPVAVCCYVASEVLNGLDYAHRKRDNTGKALNLVHRDVSPQNVVISKAGEVKLVDFGIAKTSLGGEGTEVGVIKGKYYYMSPEQAWADPMDRRSDIFSMGIVLHEMLTGRMVYSAQSIPELISKVRQADIVPPDRIRADVPAALSKIVIKALARDPANRFESALGMGEALRDFLYDFEPAFNASRLARHVAELVDAAALVEQENAVRAHASGEMSRLEHGEFVLGGDSIIAPLPEPVSVQATRKEALPHKLRRASPYAAESSPLESVGTEAGQSREAGRISGWPFGELQELGADDPTQFWHGGEARDPNDETLVDASLSLQSARLEMSQERTEAARRIDSGRAYGLARHLPPASDWPAPGPVHAVTVAKAPPLPASQGGVVALVPPPGAGAPVSTIPPSPPLPDFDRGNGLFQSGARAGIPWIQISIFLIFALVGILTLQLSRPSRAEPTLDIVSVPHGAMVHVDGTAQPGVTPLRLSALEVGRTYALRVSLRGYLPWEATYRAAKGPVKHIAVLRPITGELRIGSLPDGAQIWLDNVAIGRAPLTVSSLAVGRPVRLRARYGTRPEMSKQVVIGEADLRPTVTFDFRVPRHGAGQAE